MGKLFGTDGIRGIANKDLTAELAFKTGQSGACGLMSRNANIISSSYTLFDGISPSIILQNKQSILFTPLYFTPPLSRLCRQLPSLGAFLPLLKERWHAVPEW